MRLREFKKICEISKPICDGITVCKSLIVTLSIHLPYIFIWGLCYIPGPVVDRP